MQYYPDIGMVFIIVLIAAAAVGWLVILVKCFKGEFGKLSKEELFGLLVVTVVLYAAAFFVTRGLLHCLVDLWHYRFTKIPPPPL